ncbi:MAG TPA: class I SAM-dependent methyltransferase [Candidatus Tectomicrobia bacterium]
MDDVQGLPAEIYTDDYYLHVCGGFHEFLAGGISPRLLRAIDLADLQSGMKVLDVGSGRGELAYKCAEAGCQVWGIDYSSPALELSSQDPTIADGVAYARNVKYSRMNSIHLGFPAVSFDRVFLIDIIEHLTDDELRATVSEARRVLRPGGRLVIHTAPNAWLIEPIYLVCGLLFGWQRHPYHINEQSYFSLRRHLAGIDGTARIEITKVPRFFQLGLGPAASSMPLAARLARAMDRLFDSKLIATLISESFLRVLLGTDLWGTIDISHAKPSVIRKPAQ